MLSQLKELIPTPLKHLLKNFGTMMKYPARNLTYQGPRKLTADQWKFWRENGYLVLPKQVDQTILDQINHLVDELWATRKSLVNPLVIDVFIGTPLEKRIYFRDAPDEARKVPYKLNDVFLESDLIRDTITHPTLCEFLSDLLEGDPLICNSLTFERSSQQSFHFDTFYMPPPVENRMVASWIALEDAHEDAGLLEYYPGSHLIPPYYFSNGRLNVNLSEMPNVYRYVNSEIERRNLKPAIFPAKAGDILIWHAQLYHGGRAIKDMNRTRKSLVTHYFRTIDFPSSVCRTIAPGRHYMDRSHQRV